MVDECNRKSRKSTADPKQGPPLPLIRLRVDYTGFSTINSQRFGQKFVSKVANPHDVLHWHKAAARKVAKVSKKQFKLLESVLRCIFIESPCKPSKRKTSSLLRDLMHCKLAHSSLKASVERYLQPTFGILL